MKNKFLFAVMALILVLPFSLSAQDCCSSLKKNQSEVTIAANMTCNGCKTEIEKELGFQKGVIEVEGNLETKSVRVVYKTTKNTAENLLACVQKLGYQASLVKCCPGAEGEGHKCSGENGDGHKCSDNGAKKKGCCDKKE